VNTEFQDKDYFNRNALSFKMAPTAKMDLENLLHPEKQMLK